MTPADNLARKAIVIPASQAPEEIKLRVAAYCRVSSDSEDQRNSFAAQNAYYTEFIASKENWTLVDIYADESAIIGLSQNPIQTGGDLALFFLFSAQFSANEGVPA